MAKQIKFTVSVTEGINFKNIFESFGLSLIEAELQKTKVLVLHSKGNVVSFVSFTNREAMSITITHYSSADEFAATLFAALDEYCLKNGINTVVASILSKIRGLLAIYKRAGFKKLCYGITYMLSNGEMVKISEAHDLIKEIKLKIKL